MKQPLLITAVVSAVICGAAVVLPAVAQDVPSQNVTKEQATPVRPDHLSPPARMDDVAVHFTFGLAAQLSAAEVYIGITPDQLGPWRTYTTALQDVLSLGPRPPRPLPDFAADASGRDKLPPAQVRTDEAPEAGLPGERLAGAILAKAEKAKALQGAAQTLRTVLTSDQLAKLSGVEKMLIAPPPGPSLRGPSDPMEGPPSGDAHWHDNDGPRG
ncbi:hypothetical protein [Agrobacterium sp. NPDC090273]|uniref:hypothetical protein n=1 Tax=Agrobacterium sp. NPDC090273 TaxID=3363919 RepID=UPI00383BBDF2